MFLSPFLIANSFAKTQFKPYSCTKQKIVELSELKINDEVLTWTENEEEPECVKIADIQFIEASSSREKRDISDSKNVEYKIHLENNAQFDIYDGKVISKAKSCSSMGSCSGMSMSPVSTSWCSGTACKGMGSNVKRIPMGRAGTIHIVTRYDINILRYDTEILEFVS